MFGENHSFDPSMKSLEFEKYHFGVRVRVKGPIKKIDPLIKEKRKIFDRESPPAPVDLHWIILKGQTEGQSDFEGLYIVKEPI